MTPRPGPGAYSGECSMPTKVQCSNPSCGHTVAVPDGKTLTKCPKCQGRLQSAVDTLGTGHFRLAQDTAGDPPAPIAQTQNTGHVRLGKDTGGEKPSPAAQPQGPGQSAKRPRTTTQVECIGRFQIRTKLGAGAFGTVYRAFDPQMAREVALKVPNPGTLDSEKAIARFLREAKAAGQLKHANIVTIHEVH